MERARRAAERAQQEAERDALIAQLQELRRQTTSVHLQDFPAAAPPVVPPPPGLGIEWAVAEASAHHLSGIGLFARAERAAARQRAQRDGAAYLAAEQARLAAIHRELTAAAGQWWHRLVGNDEEIVCEAVNAAFADNPAAGCAVGLQDGVLSVVMRQQDIDSLPDRTPGITPSGRPTLKNLTKRDRVQWWLAIMGSNVVATLKEAFATAPGVTAIDLAVLTRMSDTRRLGVVVYGRWTRQAITGTRWQTPEDALRFLDLGQDTSCSVTRTSSGALSTSIKPLKLDRIPSLSTLVDNALDEGEGALSGLEAELGSAPPPAPQVPNPYETVPFSLWLRNTAPPQAVPSGNGQDMILPESAIQQLTAAFGCTGADADLVLLLTGPEGRARSDGDLVFYNQPTAARGAARLLGKHTEGPYVVERAALHLTALPADVHRVVISVAMAVGSGLTCAALTGAGLHLQSGTWSWSTQVPPDPAARALVLAELYRHTGNGHPVWRLRATGQGWPDGLPALVRAHGVNVT